MSERTSADHRGRLDAFGAAFCRHELDALMSMMAEDCALDTVTGTITCSARGHSEWKSCVTPTNSKRIALNGCYVFTLRDGRIAVKNSFRKDRPPLGA